MLISSAQPQIPHQVVNTGFVGLWPANDCLAPTAGLPEGSKKCNEFPLITAPTTLQRFLCGEPNNFKVFASDGDSPTGQPTVSNPPGAFAIRHRVRVVLPTSYNSSNSPGFPRGQSDCCIKQYAGKNETDGTLLTASGVFQWEPQCERLETDGLYSYQGRHRLDQYAACFTAVDAGASSQWKGQLASPPACVAIAVLRCTKPTIRMVFSSGQSSTNGSSYVVPVATGVSYGLEAVDDQQTRILGIYHRTDPGIPSTGATWGNAACLANSSVQITCNPVSRNFSFSAGLEHAGTR